MINPEFQRNLWLEINPHRLVLLGVALASLFTMVAIFDPQGFGNLVANVAIFIFVLMTMIWGSHRAGDAVLDELRSHTWDAQRMSALTPWSMTWGKLLGATSVAWLTGIICLAVYLIGRTGPPATDKMQLVALCIGSAIIVQALSLIGALVGTRFDKQGKSTLTSWAAVGTLLLLWMFVRNYFESDSQIIWYESTFTRIRFATVSTLTLAAWMLFGAYRMMCIELAVPTKPWAWVAFGLYLTGYFSGYRTPIAIEDLAVIGFLTFGSATYIAAFALYRDPLLFRRLRTVASHKNWSKALEETPIWMASLFFAALLGLLVCALNLSPPFSYDQVGLVALPALLHVVRDLGVLYFFTFGQGKRRVETSTVVTLAILIWLIPSILESIGAIKLSWMFRPPMWEHPMMSSAILTVHIIVAIVLCRRRYVSRIAPSNFSRTDADQS